MIVYASPERFNAVSPQNRTYSSGILLRLVGRPRTLGPTISFRLPIELHQVAVEHAEAKGQTVNQYLAARISDALRRQVRPPAIKEVTPNWKASKK